MMTSAFLPTELPDFNKIKPDEIVPMIKGLIDENRAKLHELLTQSSTFSWENLMQPMEEMSDVLSKVWSPISHLHAVKESEALRKAYNEALMLMTEYHTEISQNEKLFQAIEAIGKSADFKNLTAAQQKIIEHDLRDFKLAGIDLPASKKARLAELQKELSRLTTSFSENLLDATHSFTLHLTDPKQVEGLPAQVLQHINDYAKERGLDGYVMTLDHPIYSAAMKYLKDRVVRKTLYEAFVTRASDAGPNAGKSDNTQIMEDILKRRHEMAQLIGYDNYAAYSLATKMAKTPQQVLDFLYDLLHRSKPVAQNEYHEVEAYAKKIDGLTQLEVWDIPYYSEKLSEHKFHFSQEELKPYFPVYKVLEGMFTLVNKLYGITVRKEENVSVWHPDVSFYSLYDDQHQLRGGFYIDLFAREHKREGAWMDECRVRRLLTLQTDTHIQHPIAYLTCNFMPPTKNLPTLLTHDDVLTLFHEFGHCLHHMLTKVDFASVAGINGVEWDAVEFPSQFMENFCWEKEILHMITAHYETGATLPDELYEKMLAAKHFHTGLQMVRQLEFSIFDFRLHLEYDEKEKNFVQQTLDAVRQETSVIPVPEYNRFQNSFSHIFAGGYAAGYYSYKWAEVLSADAYSQFEENGILDSKTGHSFLSNILEVGGSRDPMESFVAFRGRTPKIDALLRHNGMI